MADTTGQAQKSKSLDQLYKNEFTKLVNKMKRHPATMTFDERKLAYSVSKAYIIAQLSVKHLMKLYMADYSASNMGGDDDDAAQAKRRQARKEAVDAMVKVEKEHKGHISAMCDLLKSVDEFSPDLKNGEKLKKRFESYKTRYVSNLVLLDQRHMVEHLRAEGILDPLDADPLVSSINANIEHIYCEPIFAQFGLPEWMRRKPQELEEILRGRGHFRKMEKDRGRRSSEVEVQHHTNVKSMWKRAAHASVVSSHIAKAPGEEHGAFVEAEDSRAPIVRHRTSSLTLCTPPLHPPSPCTQCSVHAGGSGLCTACMSVR
jgi:hypothetical protein